MTESLEDSVPLLLYCEMCYYFRGAMSFHYHTLSRFSRSLGYTVLSRENSCHQQVHIYKTNFHFQITLLFAIKE